MPAPKKGVAYSFNVAVYSVASAGALQANPTLAAGDIQISKDNGSLFNLSALPVVLPSNSVIICVSLTSTEMSADRISIVGKDQAGDEWSEFHYSFNTTTQTVDDLPTATQAADAVLRRDMSAVSAEASRSLLNALRFLRNKWTLSGTTLVVYKEDDSTSAWSASVTVDAAAQPITGSDPG